MIKASLRTLELKGTRVGTCTVCRHLVRRTVRVRQTLGPDNLGPAGAPKTEREAYSELRAELALRAKVPLVCRGCERRGKAP